MLYQNFNAYFNFDFTTSIVAYNIGKKVVQYFQRYVPIKKY